ncbi:MAG: hypothetical protein E3J35_09410 [Methanomassiliicoccales archaeon]|nr:MAG: hypothetical protein E3J35_09410 [Methanomassiliicoccales archaeon]
MRVDCWASLKGYVLDIDGNEVFVTTDKGMIESVPLSSNGSIVVIGGLLGGFDVEAVEVYFSNGTEIGIAEYVDYVEDVAITSDGSLLIVSSKDVYCYSIGPKVRGGSPDEDFPLSALALVVLFFIIVPPIVWVLLKKRKNSEVNQMETFEPDDDSIE